MNESETHHQSMKELPEEFRPREKLLRHGAQTLTNEDLVAILLRTGVSGKNVYHLAKDFCRLFDNQLHRLTTFEQDTLFSHIKNQDFLKGIGSDKFATLIAAMEFGRRIYKPTKDEMKPLKDPILRAKQIAEFMFSEVAYNAHENFWAIYLDIRQTIINDRPYAITQGLDSHTLIDPKSIYKKACLLNATSVIIVHNHPSGDVTPSEADIRTTNHLIEAGKAIGIPIKDHIIIGRADIAPHYCSLRARNLCEF